jgi:voltage-gated sodium channel
MLAGREASPFSNPPAFAWTPSSPSPSPSYPAAVGAIGQRRASDAWFTNVQRLIGKENESPAAPLVKRLFRNRDRQLALKNSRQGCLARVHRLRNQLQVVMLSTAFNGLLTAFIAANTVLVILVVDYQALCLRTESVYSCLVFAEETTTTGSEMSNAHRFEYFETMRNLQHTDVAFTTMFVVELLTKMFAFGRDFFKFGWNIFDFFVILIGVLEACLSVATMVGTVDDDFMIAAVPTMRVLRVMRVLRALRLVNIFTDLSILVKASAIALRPAAWVVFLGALCTYFFSILTTQLFGQCDASQAVNHAKLVEWFGTVPRSMFSLFQIMTLEGWSMGFVRVVMQDFVYAGVLFAVWIVLMSIGVLNLLAAIFVNSYMEGSTAMADAVHVADTQTCATKIKQLKQLLQCNTDAYLSPDEFIDRVKDSAELAHALRDLVSAERVAKAFQCIDVASTGGKASFDDLFQIALSLDDKATKEDVYHTWLLLAHYLCAVGRQVDHTMSVVADIQTVQVGWWKHSTHVTLSLLFSLPCALPA